MNMGNYKRSFKNSSNPVFITFVTYNRREILIQNIEALRNSSRLALPCQQLNFVGLVNPTYKTLVSGNLL